jgi:hypothetical protein
MRLEPLDGGEPSDHERRGPAPFAQQLVACQRRQETAGARPQQAPRHAVQQAQRLLRRRVAPVLPRRPSVDGRHELRERLTPKRQRALNEQKAAPESQAPLAR